jgi:hypothetical protein
MAAARRRNLDFAARRRYIVIFEYRIGGWMIRT